MSEIRLGLAEYLHERGLTPEDLVEAIGTTEPEMIYQLAKKGYNQSQIDLSALAAAMQGLRKLMGFPVGIEEVMQFVPDLTPEEVNLETNPWYERDVYGEIPPYDWGDEDPMQLGKPVRYVPGVGMIVEDEEVAAKIEKDTQLDRITLTPEVMGGMPCIRGLPVTVETVIALIASDYSTAGILQAHPDLEEEDLQACIAYAARRVAETKLTNKMADGHKEIEQTCEAT